MGKGRASPVIPPDVRLYTWLDFEDALVRALESEANWPTWFVDARAYWDGANIRVRPGATQVAKDWLRNAFDPRVVEPPPNLFTHLLIALESVNGSIRRLPVTLEETEEPIPEVRVLPTFARPALVQEGVGRPAQPEALPAESPLVFAFHSFKGGVGRTVHALALAQALADRGNTVLLVDADLEAPGISWLLETRLPNPPVSFADFLALVHGDPNPSASDSISLVASRLQDALLNGMYVLPAFRSARMFHSLDIRPEYLLKGRKDAYVLLNLLTSLGQSLGVAAVVIDLRAGLSELAAGLLFDPRALRIFVTSLGGQSLSGTELVLDLLARRAPSSNDAHPVPVVVLNQAPSDFRGSELLSAVEERMLSAVSRAVDKEIDAADALRGPTWFDSGLLALPASWDDALTAIRKSSIRETIQPFAHLVAAPLRPPMLKTSDGTQDPARQKLAETARRLVFAEQGEGEDFLPISPLRRLSADHRSQLPVSVIVGAKGAGKTFTYLQVVRRQSWQVFVEAAGTGRTNVDAVILPILQPKSVSGKALEILNGARQSAVAALELGNPLDPFEIQDTIQIWLKEHSHEGQWRENWLDLIAWAVGFRVRERGAGRLLSSALAGREKRLLLVFDGLEDLFQDVTTDSSQKLALRSLLQDVPNWLEQQPDRAIGILVFVRRDMVTAAVVQNSGQLLARYEPYALRWDKVEALRLVAWIARQAGLFHEPPTVEQIREMEEEGLTEALVPLWGRKLGSDRSREGRSAEWVLAALSDFLGQIQARDVVRLLYLAAGKSRGNTQWVDRVLAPVAVREAVADCSREKIAEISQENPALKEIFKKLAALVPERKSVPFKQDEVELTPAELQLLQLNGIAVVEAGSYYLAEIFRPGLEFRLPAGARPKVLALARKRQVALP
jgi:MinD-like ATPase involved in chromosome partitioning or flagellar assembly